MRNRLATAIAGALAPFVLYVVLAAALQFAGIVVFHSPQSLVATHTRQAPMEAFADENETIYSNRRFLLFPAVSLVFGAGLIFLTSRPTLFLQLAIVPFLVAIHGLRYRADLISVAGNIALVYVAYGVARSCRKAWLALTAR